MRMLSLPRAVCAALTAMACLPLGVTWSAATAAQAPAVAPSTGLYIVSLSDPPRPAVPERAARLLRAQEALLRELGRPRVLYRFTSALNGFAARLTRAQVKQLRSDPDVALVERSVRQHLDSVDSTPFVGAEKAWTAAGGRDGAGRGMVVGVLDSGIWPENPGFAALPDTTAPRPPGFRGVCVRGEQWEEDGCNNKVVAARYFVRGFGEDNLAASEYLSPRDGSGHGSHTAALAAGNAGVRVRVEGQRFGEAAGVAPAARLAAYKVCWTAPDPSDDGCTTADAVAAIDQAVSDGVDVISYAISGPTRADSDAVELAFLNAGAAGVFVATSAGNRGPHARTVAHASPWVTTVGASTHDTLQGAVVLGRREVHVGAMVSDQAVPRRGIVLAGSAAAATSTRRAARLCRPESLDPAVVQGRIVVCDRGTVPRVVKSEAVAGAGGVGMVLGNVRDDDVYPDFHAVPTVHLDVAAARAVRRYVAGTREPTAWLDPTASRPTDDSQVASFSSRGPAPRDGGDLLKPDVAAPGVGVLSAVAPASDDGRRWDQLSGTSMSTAHVAGLAALVRAEHPRWTPPMVKSAISTTADPLPGTGPMSAGAGQIDAAQALDPGVVLDAPAGRFRAWLAGRVETRNLNLPSIALGGLTGRTRVIRTLTNVSGARETFSARVQGLEGLDVGVRPQALTLGRGETGRFVVDVDRTTARLGSHVRGALVWTGSRHRARIPVVVTPRALSAPREATASGTSGTLSFEGVSGAGGRLGLETAGPVPAMPTGITLVPGSFDRGHPAVDADTARFHVAVPAGADVLRVELGGRDSDDLDLHLYRDAELVAAATGSGADEVLTRTDPEPGSYEVYVSSAVAANGSTTTAQLYTWVVRPGHTRGLSVPDSVQVSRGQPFRVKLRWRGLDPTARWFGQVRYGRSGERTFLTVN